MDIVTIEPKMLKGTVCIPPSKSVAHRAIIAAALSGEPCVLSNVTISEDIEATLNCVRILGVAFRKNTTKKEIKFCKRRKKKLDDEIVLDCNESGSTLRFIMPVALLSGKTIRLKGRGRLMERLQEPYFDIFEKKGIEWSLNKDEIVLKGSLKNGEFKLAGDVSSQFITGLLFALPLLDGDSTIKLTTPLESKGYIDLTLEVLKKFGIEIKNNDYKIFKVKGGQKYKETDYIVEGDYSQAAFFLVAGALGCDIRCVGLNPESMQGDKEIIEILKEVGAKIVVDEEGGISARQTASMRGITIDAKNIPDLVPILAVLCGFCKGESRIISAGRLRLKESDRLSAIRNELSYMGLDIKEGADFLHINGTNALVGRTVSSWNDHRIAMSLAIASCRCEGRVAITDAKKAVCKSYPDFFDIYKRLQMGPSVLGK